MNDKFTASCQTNMSSKHYIKLYKKVNSENLLGEHVLNTTIVIRFNLPRVCPSVSPFVLAVIFTPLSLVLSVYFLFHPVW